MEDLSDLPPVPSVRERDIDLLIAHLASTSIEFVRWMLDTASPGLGPLPTGLPHSARAVINYSRPDAGGAASGETDVLIVASFDTDQLLLSIENKAWASAQPNQAARHRAFVETTDAKWKFALLVAPTGWVASHRAEADGYHGTLTVEAVADWCGAHGHPFHGEVLATACTQPEFMPALDLLSWHEQADMFLAAHSGLRLEPQRYVRTSNAGAAKPARWTSFARHTLTPIDGLPHPWLMIRPGSTNHPCRLAVDFPKAPQRLLRTAKDLAAGTGISCRQTRAGTLIVELEVPTAAKFDMAAPFDTQTEFLTEIANSTHTFISWWQDFVEQQGAPGERSQ